MRQKLKSLLCTAIPLLFSTLSFSADLDIEISGVKSNAGAILLVLIDNQKSYQNLLNGEMNEEVYAYYLLSPYGDRIELSIKNYPEGEYVMVVMHDENSNGELDTSKFGIPTEGFGISNYAGGDLPGYEEAKVRVDGKAKGSTKMLIHYPR
ncbi:DUF2141 domain-containing protein [Pseudoteredinibacter isoporae]|uniref:Uncharacterized protein (DUF2141 family) n=1 Tax=Pseudoteredinibacter isoporae TaxID=570281 RepID=A0A7X0JUR4_9GAMM|nr:DUF2141 domain-containing protein [Pseudoteredinibacter isoporae]MBB6522628.1 uncharacterized protein (DUF2141 family) [Pseudoteredinibacter isoporae]NHO88158.1 DUF2141 domain-containing protein [Pseudoteredinibacter isoporae]NIB23511.1 DUF2141 domain-containing protein [Pseudoteredinibacter isoporae]